MKELTDCLPGSRKTFSRDLRLRRQAGVPIVYKAKQNAFLLEQEGLFRLSNRTAAPRPGFKTISGG